MKLTYTDIKDITPVMRVTELLIPISFAYRSDNVLTDKEHTVNLHTQKPLTLSYTGSLVKTLEEALIIGIEGALLGGFHCDPLMRTLSEFPLSKTGVVVLKISVDPGIDLSVSSEFDVLGYGSDSYNGLKLGRFLSAKSFTCELVELILDEKDINTNDSVNEVEYFKLYFEKTELTKVIRHSVS